MTEDKKPTVSARVQELEVAVEEYFDRLERLEKLALASHLSQDRTYYWVRTKENLLEELMEEHDVEGSF